MNLDKVRYIDFNRLNKLEGIELIAACDVKNHLLGENGATYVSENRRVFSRIRFVKSIWEWKISAISAAVSACGY